MTTNFIADSECEGLCSLALWRGWLREMNSFNNERRNAVGRLGLSPLQKCTVAMRMLAYDVVDEYLRMGESTTRIALRRFCQGVISQFESDYDLRSPNAEDLQRILHQNERRGFPGMIGSIDCMHWEWKNYPAAWKAQYAGRSKNATLILEAVADQDLWIWHAFFGMSGSCNDLNVLNRSTVFDEVLQGRAPPISFSVNDQTYNYGYYLADGIFPKWSTFIQGVIHPQVQKDRLFTDKQAARKDAERAFGVLQARFAIIREPSLVYDEDILCDIMKACIILHNMIVEDERHNYTRADVLRMYYEEDRPQRRTANTSGTSTSATINNNEPFEFNVGRPGNIDYNMYIQRRVGIRDKKLI